MGVKRKLSAEDLCGERDCYLEVKGRLDVTSKTKMDEFVKAGNVLFVVSSLRGGIVPRRWTP
jgi:hypothetical protein